MNHGSALAGSAGQMSLVALPIEQRSFSAWRQGPWSMYYGAVAYLHISLRNQQDLLKAL